MHPSGAQRSAVGRRRCFGKFEMADPDILVVILAAPYTIFYGAGIHLFIVHAVDQFNPKRAVALVESA